MPLRRCKGCGRPMVRALEEQWGECTQCHGEAAPVISLPQPALVSQTPVASSYARVKRWRQNHPEAWRRIHREDQARRRAT